MDIRCNKLSSSIYWGLRESVENYLALHITMLFRSLIIDKILRDFDSARGAENH